VEATSPQAASTLQMKFRIFFDCYDKTTAMICLHDKLIRQSIVDVSAKSTGAAINADDMLGTQFPFDKRTRGELVTQYSIAWIGSQITP
jgi:hypothetical protein